MRILISLLLLTISPQPLLNANVSDFDVPNKYNPLEKEKVVETPIYDRKLKTREDVKEYIRWHAEFMEIDPNLALELARIESNFNPKAKNPNSSAGGVYMFIDSTWKMYCQSDTYKPSKFDAKTNIQCAHRLLFTKDFHHWTV